MKYNILGKVFDIVSKRSKIYTKKINKKGSITSIEKININKFDQNLLIRGNNKNNPILLYIHGGPGCSEFGLLNHFNYELEKNFIVVTYDQRGACRSYHPNMKKEELSTKVLFKDLESIVNYLLMRFNKKKLYLMGHSWGTILSIIYARKHPRKLHAYISISQVVDLFKSEEICHNKLIDTATKHKNKKAVKELKMTDYLYPNIGDDYLIRINQERKWVQKFGYSLYGKKSMNSLATILLKSTEYSWHNLIIYNYSSEFSTRALWKEMIMFNALKHIPKLKTRAIFIQGRHDFQTPLILLENYFKKLKAKNKKLIIFENSAHNPIYEEPKKFNEIIKSLLNN